jgi:hypothetical protein
VVDDRPLLILARNGIDHALIAYATMGQGHAGGACVPAIRPPRRQSRTPRPCL